MIYAEELKSPIPHNVYFVDSIPDKPGYCIVTFYDDDNKYMLELPESVTLTKAIDENYSVYLNVAKLNANARRMPNIEQLRADVDFIAIMADINL